MSGHVGSGGRGGQDSSLVRALGRAVTTYDGLTGRHSGRVGALAELLAAQLDLAFPDRLVLAHAGILHDLGKLGIASTILDKEGRLEPDDMADIHRHPIIGAEMLLALSPDLAPMADGVRAHHERWDGNGYPYGLAGEDIPLFGRVLAVVDVYDSLTHPRTYRKTVYSAGRARSFVEDHAGSHFDPECVSAIVAALRERENAKRQFGL